MEIKRVSEKKRKTKEKTRQIIRRTMQASRYYIKTTFKSSAKREALITSKLADNVQPNGKNNTQISRKTEIYSTIRYAFNKIAKTK